MRRQFVIVGIVSILLVTLLTACTEDNGEYFNSRPLGYAFVAQKLLDVKPRTVIIPPSQAKPVTHLRMYGIGVPPEGFVTQYGSALSPSQPPTQLWFKATLDTFPAGSVLIAGFDRSSLDNAPRANEISYVLGLNHRTTITQAETIATSFLPDDTVGPTSVQRDNNRCQSETYTSPTLAKLFPPRDFLDGNGNTAKAGTVTLSLFPPYQHSDDHVLHKGEGSVPVYDNPNNISSFLLTLGTKAYC